MTNYVEVSDVLNKGRQIEFNKNPLIAQYKLQNGEKLVAIYHKFGFDKNFDKFPFAIAFYVTMNDLADWESQYKQGWYVARRFYGFNDTVIENPEIINEEIKSNESETPPSNTP